MFANWIKRKKADTLKAATFLLSQTITLESDSHFCLHALRARRRQGCQMV
jgi:hypothetical protein